MEAHKGAAGSDAGGGQGAAREAAAAAASPSAAAATARGGRASLAAGPGAGARPPLEVVRWGIIGVGDVCEIKSGPALQKCAGSALVAVMRRTAALAESFARRHGVPRWYADVDALLADPEVNAVYIATPPGSHLQLALRCLVAGLPTYLEKPAARNASETRAIAAAFEAAGVPLFVAYYRRGQAKFRAVKELVARGELGDVTSLSYRMVRPPWIVEPLPDGSPGKLPWRFDAAQAGGGLVMDVGCHTIDIIDYIVGPLAGATGVATGSPHTRYDVEDGVAISATFGEGSRGVADLSWTFAGPPGSREDSIVIRGTRGTLTMSTFGTEPVEVAAAGSAGETRRLTFEPPQHAHQPLVQLIVDELRGGAASPSKGDNAVRVAEVLDAALAGYYGGRTDAFWERRGAWPGQACRSEAATAVVASAGAGGAGAGGGGGGGDGGAGAGAGPSVLVFVGCYTQKMGHVPDGRGEGVTCLAFDPATGAFSQVGEPQPVGMNPTWICINRAGSRLYVANEVDDSAVTAFSVEVDASGTVSGSGSGSGGRLSLTRLSRTPTQGAHACYCELDPAEACLAAVNYTGGQVATMVVRPDGGLAPAAASVVAHTAEDAPAGLPGIAGAEQEAVHPHQSRFRDGHLFVVDKGCDAVVRYAVDGATGALTKLRDGRAALQPGAGARHVDWHPTLPVAYVVGEIDCTVTVFAYDAATASFGGRLQVRRALPTKVHAGANAVCDFVTGAQLLVHPGGGTVYVSNRGHNSIASFAVDPTTGLLAAPRFTETRGKTPRNFTLSPDGRWLLVANQDSHSVVSFAIASDGRLDPERGTTFKTYSPVCLQCVV